MSRVHDIIMKAVVAEGVALPNWKVEERIVSAGYQFVELEVTVYEPRKKKPTGIYNVPYDSFRNILHWCDAKCTYYRYWYEDAITGKKIR